MTTPLTITLERPQALAHRWMGPGHTTVTPWGRGGGKSWILRLNWWERVAQWDGRWLPGAPDRGVRIVLLMPYLAQAKRVHADRMIEENEGPWRCLGGKINRTDWRVEFPGGSWIQWVSAERLDANRGIRCDIVGVDECDDIDAARLDSVVVPWFTEIHSLRETLFSGTFRRGRQGLLYRQHQRGSVDAKGQPLIVDVDGKPYTNRFRSVHATCYDFPKHVSAQAIEDAKRDIAPEIFKREWLADPDASQGLVYSDFRENFHVRAVSPDQAFTEVLVGGDHGYEDPGCLILIGIMGHGADATAHIVAEIYEQHRELDWWRDKVRLWAGWYPSARWFFDPSAPDKIRSYERAGAKLGEVDNSIEDGVACVQNLLKVRERGDDTAYARLYVDPSCVNTIREFGTYKRKRDPRDRELVIEAIEDKHNHAMDAVRYPLLARFRTAPPRGGRNQRGLEARQ